MCAGLLPALGDVMRGHMEDASVQAVACMLLAKLCCGCEENREELFRNGIPEILMDVMRVHSDDGVLQYHACCAVTHLILGYGLEKRAAWKALHKGVTKSSHLISPQDICASTPLSPPSAAAV